MGSTNIRSAPSSIDGCLQSRAEEKSAKLPRTCNLYTREKMIPKKYPPIRNWARLKSKSRPNRLATTLEKPRGSERKKTESAEKRGKTGQAVAEKRGDATGERGKTERARAGKFEKLVRKKSLRRMVDTRRGPGL